MKTPYPAQHDQQQAAALDALRGAKAFVLVHFLDSDEECDHPFCAAVHNHRATEIITSCNTDDLHLALKALAQEAMLMDSVQILVNLDSPQREQIAEAIRRGDTSGLLSLRDDDDE